MKYSIQLTEKDACAYGTALPISTKTSVEICRALRNKTYTAAKDFLAKVIEEKVPVAFLRYKHNVGHRKGPMAAGRYPGKASMNILQLLESAAANAANKGLAVGNLVIKHISAHNGPKTMHYGRNPGQAKKTHIQIILTETKTATKTIRKEKNMKKKTDKTIENKTEAQT